MFSNHVISKKTWSFEPPGLPSFLSFRLRSKQAAPHDMAPWGSTKAWKVWVQQPTDAQQTSLFWYVLVCFSQKELMDTFQKCLSGNHYISDKKGNWYDARSSSLEGGVTRIRNENSSPQASASFALVWRYIFWSRLIYKQQTKGTWKDMQGREKQQHEGKIKGHEKKRKIWNQNQEIDNHKVDKRICSGAWLHMKKHHASKLWNHGVSQFLGKSRRKKIKINVALAVDPR